MEKETQLILNYFDQLAIKLGVGIEHIWPWFIKQQYIEAFYSITLFVIISIVFGFYIKYFIQHWDRQPLNTDTNKVPYSVCKSEHEPLIVIGGVVLGFLFLISLFVSLCNAIDLFNPKYAAFKDIVEMTKAKHFYY